MSKITGLLRLMNRPIKLLKQLRKVEEVPPIPPLRSIFYCGSFALGLIILLILVIAMKILKKKRLDCSVNDGSPLTTSTQEKRSVKHSRISNTSCTDISSSSSSVLSPDIWALVMNFLPYESVLQTAAVSKSMLHEVMPLVTMLHINKSSQLYAGSIASRYNNVRDISIYSLIDYHPFTNQEDLWEESPAIDEDTATRAIPFLSSFKKLERVFLGGQNVNNGSVEGFMPTNDTNDEKKEIMKNLINSFSAGFRSGALSKDLWVLGLRCPDSHFGVNMFNITSSCPTCIKACKSFPIDSVLNFEQGGNSEWHMSTMSTTPNQRSLDRNFTEQLYSLDVCVTLDQIEDIVSKRTGGKELLHSKERFLDMLGNGTRLVIIDKDDTELYVVKYNGYDLKRLRRFIEKSQLNVKTLCSDVVTEAIKRSFAADERDLLPPRNRCYLAASSFRELRSMGIAFDEADFLNDDEWDGKRIEYDEKRDWDYYNWRFS